VISELGCEVVGVDHSASNLELARSKGGNIEYIQFDATKEFGKLVNETGWTTTFKFQKGGAQLIIVE
jgi:hypothetical protein